MKIIHTADWHLGNVFHGHVRTEEHRHFLNRLLDMLRDAQPDVLLVTGDIFDSANPSAQAEKLLYNFLQQAVSSVPGLQIVLTAGNHDSAGRIEAPAELLKMHNVYVRGTLHFDDSGEPDFDHFILPLAPRGHEEAQCVCFALPYLRSCDYPAGMSQEDGLRHYFTQMYKRLRKSDFKGLPVIVAAHFYAAGAEICQSEHSERLVAGGQECVNADVTGNRACYTALGHIHKAQQVKGVRHTYYAGSALPMSFAETAYKHGVYCVNIDSDGETEVTRLDYTPLRGLMTIPASGRKATTVAEALDEISRLPRRAKNDDGDDWPYLEIRIEERQPEPGLMHDVMEALADRAVHFCRMVRVRPDEEKASAQKLSDSLSAEMLQGISPLKLAREHFMARYDSDMPQPLIDRFKQAAQAAGEVAGGND